jgi:hypothetical protein
MTAFLMWDDLLARATEITRLAETMRMMSSASQAARADATDLYSLFLRAPRENHLYDFGLEKNKKIGIKNTHSSHG